MTTVRYIVGDSLKVLRGMPDASVDLVLSSPPFLALRSYLPMTHPDKGSEMGSEPTPGEYLDALLDVVEECRRALAPHGSLCFELGDTYAGSGGAGGDYAENGLRKGQQRFDGSASRAFGTGAAPRPARKRPQGRDWGRSKNNPSSRNPGPGWPLDKSLVLVPELLRFALAYGFNPLTGRETERWRVRNVVRWHRPNPPVGALGDKFRPATTDIVVACMSRKRYFDLDAVRGPASPNTHARTARGVDARPSTGKTTDDERRGGNFSSLATLHETNGAPPLDTWVIPTAPYKGSHYATWPPDLLPRLILSMCPERVCETCGAPSERITMPRPGSAYESILGRDIYSTSGRSQADRATKGRNHEAGQAQNRATADLVTTGFTDCGHDTWRAGVVLDPFAGSGTTGVVAHGHSRSAVLIDIDERNAGLARERIGMWLEVDDPVPAGTA